MQVYEVVVVSEPTKEQLEKGVKPEIVIPLTCVMAKDSMSAAMSAIQKSGKDVDFNEIKVLVRSFQ